MVGSGTRNRNVVLVTVDSLRADYCYDEDVPTPTLDAMAESGVKYETAIAPGPATYESMPAIFTGTQLGWPDDPGGLNQRARIASHLRAHRPLPARLRDRGYTTIGVSPNPFTSREFGFDTGFDRFVDFLDSSSINGRVRRRIVSRWSEGEFVGGLRFAINMLGRGDVSVDCSQVVSRALSELVDAPEPVFLWLMFLDPHWPYRPPRRYLDGIGLSDRYLANWRASNVASSTPTEGDAETLRELYRGTIRSVDDCLGTLQAELEPYDPIYVVHADHGEAFGEHGRFGHGGGLYEENVRVPLVVGNIGSRQNVRAPVSLREMPRLVTSLTDAAPEFRTARNGQTYAISEHGDLCVRGRDWKYYIESNGSTRFYDLRADPNEQSGTPVSIDRLEDHYSGLLMEMSRLKRACRDSAPRERL